MMKMLPSATAFTLLVFYAPAPLSARGRDAAPPPTPTAAPGGMAMDGMTTDSMEMDGMETDRMEMDGWTADSMEMDGMETDGMATDSMEMDGMETDRMETDRMEMDGMTMDPISKPTPYALIVPPAPSPYIIPEPAE